MPTLPDIEVVQFAKEFLDKHLDRFNKDIATPWSVSYDHRAVISVRGFASDIIKSVPNPDHAFRGNFLHVRRADACRRSVWRDRCEATRDAARSGLICRVGGSSGHTAPRLMGLTA